MSATTSEREHGTGDEVADTVPEDTAVVVRRRADLLLLLGGLSSSLAIAFLWRATGSGSWVDAVVCALLGALGAGYLAALIDARAPLLVADALGVRIRVGREWRGLPWSSVERLWLLPRDGMRRDARLVVVPAELGDVVEGLEPSSVRSMQLTQRLHGAPLALPLGLTTRVSSPGSIAEDLRSLCAGHRTEVRELDAEQPSEDVDVPRLTDELVARREAVVRALPGGEVPETTAVTHVALVPEQGADDATDDDAESADYSLLGRFFGRPDRDDTDDATADVAGPTVPTEPAALTHEERSDDEHDVRHGPGEDAGAPAVPAAQEGPLDVDDPEGDLESQGPPRVPWWHRVRRLAAGEPMRTAAPGDPDQPDVVEHEPAPSHDSSEGTAGRQPAGDQPPAPAVPAAIGPAPATVTSTPTDETSGAPSEPVMAPAARVAVAPMVASRHAARRVEVVHRVEDAPSEGAAALDRDHDTHGVHVLPESAVLRPGQDDLLLGGRRAEDTEDTQDTEDSHDVAGVTPLARPGDAVAPLMLGGYATRPAYDPVIGPEVTAARTRLGMSVDELADRTRIRPHVIEALEVDDFVPSGGDVYARGHLRTLGRVLGKDPEPWVTQFDSRYATGGTTARRVFEAELASAARPAHSPRSGPHWSLVAAVVAALALVWGAASALGDDPVEVLTPAPLVAPAAGQQADMPAAVPVRVLQLSAADQPAAVTVRDADGAVALVTALQPGETRRVRLALPVRVVVTEGGPVRLAYDGQGRGRLAAPDAVVPGQEGEAALPSVRRLR